MAKAATAKKTVAKADSEPEYGVDDLAKILGVSGGYCRVLLRKYGVKKMGKSYGWDTKKDLETVAKQLTKEAA